MLISDDDYFAILEPFAIDVVANPGINTEFTFQAIFDNGEKIFGEDGKMTAGNPVLTARSIDVDSLKKGSSLLLKTKYYKVRYALDDQSGITKLELINQ